MLLRPQWVPDDDLGQQVGREAHEVAQPRSSAVERGRQDPQPLPLAPGRVPLLPLLSLAERAKWRMSNLQVRETSKSGLCRISATWRR